jgi:adenosylcobinamide-phosphate guanylyltransferase
MCGGQGTRLAGATGEIEKPLVDVNGTTMLDRVLDALDRSSVDRIVAACSPQAPTTRTHLDTANSRFAPSTPFSRIDTPGEGYVNDLDLALDHVSDPALTVACDLPLLAPAVVDRTLAAHAERSTSGPERRSLTVCVPVALKRALGVSTDSTWTPAERELAPTGLNVVARDPADVPDSATGATAGTDRSKTDPDETTHVSYDARLAVNVNRPADLAVAEALCE